MKKEFMELVQSLISVAPTSAGLERLFGNMRVVNSDLMNRLLPEKVVRLAFCLRCLNDETRRPTSTGIFFARIQFFDRHLQQLKTRLLLKI